MPADEITRRSGEPPFMDNPGVSETFVDGVSTLLLENGMLTVTFTTKRAISSEPVEVRRVASARIVMPFQTANELFAKINQAKTMIQASHADETQKQ